MQKVSQLLPNDSDAKTLYAAALFDLVGWNFWDLQGNPNAHTLDIIKILESALKLNPNNPGANHFYVHIIEWSPYPQKALPNAEKLSHLVPGSEHLAHMPCHTYYSVGRYHDATIANQSALQIYKNYEAACQSQGFIPEIQYLYYHNYDYLVTAASMEGRRYLSLQTADQLAKEITPLAEKNPGLQKMLTDQIVMRVRFGEWKQILNMPSPLPQSQYAVGIWHYAQGIAALQLGNTMAAKKHLKQLQLIIKQGPIPANLDSIGITLLKIAENTLQGLLAAKEEQNLQAENYFKKAIELQDSLTSADPPPWYFPERQLLGLFYLKLQNYSAARQLFLVDLKKHPHNGWSLFGLEQALRKLDKKNEADQVHQKFLAAWKYSDINPATLYDHFFSRELSHNQAI